MLKRRAIPTASPDTQRPQARGSAVTTRQTITPEASTSTSVHDPQRRPTRAIRTRRTPGARDSPVVDLIDVESVENTPIPSPQAPASACPMRSASITMAIEPPTKRQRTSVPPTGKPALVKSFNINGAEEIDLTDADDDASLNILLRKNQEDRLKAQNLSPVKRKLGNIQCVICLDDPTDLAATPCGHLFCNLCLQGALRAGPQPNPKHGRCPVCRRKVMHKDVTLLEIKRIAKPQSEKSKGKMKAR